MLGENKTFKLIELFITCDYFYKALTHWQTQPTTRQGGRQDGLTDSEMLAITIFYQHSSYKYFFRHNWAVTNCPIVPKEFSLETRPFGLLRLIGWLRCVYSFLSQFAPIFFRDVERLFFDWFVEQLA